MTETGKLNHVAQEFADTFGNELLHGIDEIIFSEPISWLPQTLAWKLLLCVVALYGLWCLAGTVRTSWRNRYRKVALRELKKFQKQPDVQIRQLPFLLKATALHAFPRAQIAQLSGTPWLTFLNSTYDGPRFDGPVGRLLIMVAYNPSAIGPEHRALCAQLVHLGQRWIKEHQSCTT